jgi:3-hydroxybutyryl-CoA dehydrogenase
MFSLNTGLLLRWLMFQFPIDKALATILKNFDRQVSKGIVIIKQKEHAIRNITTYLIHSGRTHAADLVISRYRECGYQAEDI